MLPPPISTPGRKPLFVMNTSTNLTSAQEEALNDEQLLDDIRRTVKAVTIPKELDFRALAVQATDQYWSDREKGLINREGERVNDIAIAYRAAQRRMVDPLKETLVEAAFALIPSVIIIIVLWLLPVQFGRNRYVIFGYLLLALTGLVASLLIAKRIVQAYRGIEERPSYIEYTIGALAGGLLAAALSGSLSLQEKIVNRQAHEELKTASLELAQNRMLDLSRVTMEQKLNTGELNGIPQPSQPLEPNNKRNLRITSDKISRDKLVYRAESEELPAPLEVKIDKNTGAISLLKDGMVEERAKFFVGTVEEVSISSHTFTLKVSGEQGVEKILALSYSPSVSQPIQGQSVFVVTDPDVKEATAISGLNKGQKLPVTPGNSNSLSNNNKNSG